MAGTFTNKILASGQLPLVTGDLYPVPGSTTAIIVSILVVNRDAGPRLVNIYLAKAGGATTIISPVNELFGAGFSDEIIKKEVTLGPGDKIRGDADAAGAVDFSIFGVEET